VVGSVCHVGELAVENAIETRGGIAESREGKGSETGIAAIAHERERVLLLECEGGIGAACSSG